MASLPYVTSAGNIDRALEGIKKAAVPERVSQDFVKTVLGIRGGSGDQIASFLKKIGFAGSDGTPNETYRKFRNPASSGVAVAEAIRNAYAPLYVRNEFMHQLDDQGLLGLVVEETGLAHDSNPVKMTVSCIKHLKKFANFDEASVVVLEEPSDEKADDGNGAAERFQSGRADPQSLGLNLGYTINLNLPATSDPAVFDAIFKSLRDNLLRSDDV